MEINTTKLKIDYEAAFKKYVFSCWTRILDSNENVNKWSFKSMEFNLESFVNKCKSDKNFYNKYK